MSLPIYLDYAATTPVDPTVAEAMTGCLTMAGNFANPASRSHRYGWLAEEAVETARRQVADLLHADPRAIVWTSGATEANNLAIKGVAEALAAPGSHFVTSAIEHKAVLDCYQYLEGKGFQVTYLPPNNLGEISLEQVEAALRPETVMVSLMHVNNEIGVINDIAALGQLCRERGVLLHVDAAQSAGKLAIDVNAMQVDLMSVCGHKIYGPKGVGALYVRRTPPLTIAAQIHGGGHERGMRSGTLPTHQCVGMGAAFALAATQLEADGDHYQQLLARFLAGIQAIGGITVNGDSDRRVANIINLAFADVDGEKLMLVLRELAISSGSACTSASIEPSYVLRALGLPHELALSSLRFSFGRYTQLDDIDRAVAVVREGVGKLRGLSARTGG
ncbi:IscS subfamily cysteine desulfurase [Halioxenophilus sp. WMMB6]|uniref:IscS subfamily cysteine desulfurase n=1 Tax=Halioxenophilus sp. WMMB6 TaxID=3073815 RepID=UPI00295EE8C4|nr:IscS subfamily cysteine desulfurase [Halioxenophilus sp. WMMB6]